MLEAYATNNVCIKLSTINIKINGTSEGVYSPLSKLHSIFALENLLAHNNITISYIYIAVSNCTATTIGLPEQTLHW